MSVSNENIQEDAVKDDNHDGRSRIFLGCRSLGTVSGELPLVARYIKRRKETLIVTVVGRCFYTYGTAHLSLLAVSRSHPEDITCVAGDAYHIYSACGLSIFAWRRGTELKHTYKGHEYPVHLLLPFGHILLSVDRNSTLKAWYIKEEEEYLELPFNNDVFEITTLTHPSAYLNKILLGSRQGSLQLWNVKTSKLIYTFEGWNSPVTVVQQAPAMDVVAIATADGKIKLLNLKADKTIMEFEQTWGSVTSISFRTDGHPIMVTGSSKGHLIMWNLEERKVASQVEKAHVASVASCVCFPSEPIVATNSSDNSLKIWIFDMADGGARLLRIREGHSSPPCFVRYAGLDGRTILTAGTDSTLRILSSAAGQHPISLGQASFHRQASKKKKRGQYDSYIMPPISSFSYSLQRDKEWDSIASVHRGLSLVTTWSLDKRKMGSHKMQPENVPNNVKALCATVSHCGHFVFIGYSNGEVYKFNMQSGYERGRWGGEKGAHAGPIRGIETDHLNKRVFTASLDNRLKVWNFEESKLPMKIVKLDEAVSFTRCHRESALIMLCNEDFSINVFDMDTLKIVRKFNGHISKINDACFSYDSRWLISASMDCTICTWDIPTGQLIDVFKVDIPCISLSMSPNGDFLVSAHAGLLGVYLWANRTLYAHISLRPIDIKNISIPTLELPSIAYDAPVETLEEFEKLNLGDEDEFKSPEQISEELITLSNLPTSRWQHLLNIDLIKQRNKPKQPPKAPKAAPFFLPTIPSLEVQFDLSDVQMKDDSRVLVPESFNNFTVFGKMLGKTIESNDFSECIEKMKSFGPSMIDLEINTLSPENGGSLEIMNQFLKMINNIFMTNKDFELAQSYLSLFLKVHGPQIVESSELRETLCEIETSQTAGWEKLQNMLFYNLCVVKSVKNM